jgi:hypothetical protein
MKYVQLIKDYSFAVLVQSVYHGKSMSSTVLCKITNTEEWKIFKSQSHAG